MTTRRKEIGNLGESLAEAHLKEKGYQIVAKNWRCKEGELDLVAQQQDMLVFVEVKTRRGTRLGTPEEGVTTAKQARLVNLAAAFLAEYPTHDCPWRIDVIAIVLNNRNQVTRFNHIEYAVEG